MLGFFSMEALVQSQDSPFGSSGGPSDIQLLWSYSASHYSTNAPCLLSMTAPDVCKDLTSYHVTTTLTGVSPLTWHLAGLSEEVNSLTVARIFILQNVFTARYVLKNTKPN
jgi:hypothetical protein